MISAPVYFALGIAAAVVGLLPWLVAGLRLPLQYLWATEVLPAAMPIALLPFSQYAITLIVGMLVTGAALAGAIARLTRTRRTRFGLPALAAGVVLLQLVATVQSAVVVSGGLLVTRAAGQYLVALTAGTVASILLGLALLLLVARAPAPGVVIAMGIIALALGQWLESLALPFGVPATDWRIAVLGALRWVPGIVVGIAVGVGGFRTAGRIAAAVTAGVVLWAGPALITAITSAAGTRVLLPYPAEMAEYGAQVFVSALGLQNGASSTLLLAVVVTVITLAARWALQRRRLATTER